MKLYDSLYHDIIEEEVTEQVKSLMSDSYIGLVNVPVQQQLNGSDCGVFAVAFKFHSIYLITLYSRYLQPTNLYVETVYVVM